MSRGRLLLLIALAAVAVELFALRPVLWERDGPIDDSQVMYGLIACSFIAFGLVAWQRRPDSRVGMLMTAAGFGFFVAPVVIQFDGPVAFLISVLLLDPWPFFFVALLLSLLTRGRLQSRFDRLLVASYAIPMWVVPLALLLFLDLDGLNPLVAFPDAGVADALLNAVWVAWLAVMGATVAVLVARWWAASGPRRRALLPTLAGALALLLFAAMLVHDLFNETRSEVLMWIAHLTLLAVPAALLAGMLRSRLARGGLTELFPRLGTATVADLQEAIRRVLGDPGAVLAFAGDAAPGPRQRVMPVGRAATLVYDSSLDEDPELVEAVAAATAVAIENERLRAEADQRLEELKASRERIIGAGDAERRRLERNLHDGAQQRLVGIALQLRLLQSRLGDDPAATELAATASAELAESLAELRELARGMHPAVLEHGLPAALGALANRSTVATTVSCETRERLPDPVELTAYFVASEALANVAKYAHASRATVRLWRDNGSTCIEIADDGVGGADETLGSGLRGLADRVEALEGQLSISSPPGRGTTVTAELPCR